MGCEDRLGSIWTDFDEYNAPFFLTDINNLTKKIVGRLGRRERNQKLPVNLVSKSTTKILF